MICLAFDTAGKACSACLYDSANDEVLAKASEEIGKGHAEKLMDIIGEVMQSAKITYQDLDKIVTTIGPGSFTGIRVGVATARGFGVGLEIPVVGVNNLEAILFEFTQSRKIDPSKNFGAVMTAGRGEVYCLMEFETPFAAAGVPFAAELETLTAALEDQDNLVLCGSAAEALGHENAEFNQNQADISFVARLGATRSENGKKPEPLYLRKPDAVSQKGFAVERSG